MLGLINLSHALPILLLKLLQNHYEKTVIEFPFKLN